MNAPKKPSHRTVRAHSVPDPEPLPAVPADDSATLPPHIRSFLELCVRLAYPRPQ